MLDFSIISKTYAVGRAPALSQQPSFGNDDCDSPVIKGIEAFEGMCIFCERRRSPAVFRKRDEFAFIADEAGSFS